MIEYWETFNVTLHTKQQRLCHLEISTYVNPLNHL